MSKNAEEFLVKGKEALMEKTGAVEQHKVGRDVTYGNSWIETTVSLHLSWELLTLARRLT